MTRSLHHANLLVGTPDKAESYLRSLCDDLGVTLANNPDFFAFRMHTFGIDDARQLALLSARKAVTHRKFFLISAARLTLEAQNALLKTFEDPFPNTHFFLAVREESLIVPTLLSRMQVSRLNLDCQGSTLTQEADKFLSLSPKDRLLFAKEFALEERNLSVFLDSLLSLIRKQKKTHGVESVYNVRRFASDSTALPRLIIEHLSLVLP